MREIDSEGETEDMFSIFVCFSFLFFLGGGGGGGGGGGRKMGEIVTGRSIETQEERERERYRCLFFGGGGRERWE